MIGPQDIAAFAVENKEYMEAATQFRRRAERGLPDDRWADGSAGMLDVAKGIWAMEKALDMFAVAASEMMEAQKEASRVSMALGEPKN